MDSALAKTDDSPKMATISLFTATSLQESVLQPLAAQTVDLMADADPAHTGLLVTAANATTTDFPLVILHLRFTEPYVYR